MFPGGCLVGDSLGVVNMATLQGTGNAIESGILLADSLLKVEFASKCGVELEGGRLSDRIGSQCVNQTAEKIQKSAGSVRAWLAGGNDICCMCCWRVITSLWREHCWATTTHSHMRYRREKTGRRRKPRSRASSIVPAVMKNQMM